MEFHSQKKQKPCLLEGTTNYMMMMMIPDDVLLTNIFIRLPARQAAKMRSLSKTWNSLLPDPSFIKSHLDRSKDEILMVFERYFHLEKVPFTEHTITYCQTDDVPITNSVKVVHTSSISNSLYGSVNGLICLHGNQGVKIWNPSLSALMVLPPYRFNKDICIDIRFGFDPKTNDYKVVKLSYFDEDDLDGDLIYNWLPVEVFSLRKGCWESITERFPPHIQTVESTITKNDVFVDGHDGRLHYLCTTANDLPTVVAFDLGDETFSEIALPDDCFYRVNELAILSQKLCVMSCLANGGCEVWVMENYGVATSWVKRHVVPEYKANKVIPIGFTLNNQFLFGHGMNLSLYDPEASSFRCFKGAALLSSNQYNEGMDPFTNSAKVVPYVDSLVWVNTL
uniref:F-box/kelch-repeat protein At3g06240-like n=1 Tax=Erigeron canadensis TaxID=72917 RepID=UPI001CB9C940|nr:F-box/kelch-repeat protein At3g06240-like [Erigeron canadensis]